MNTLKTDLKNTKAKLTAAENDLKKTKTDLKDLGKVVDDHKTISQNNLKYLINVDRNTRRINVVIFGVPEDGTLELNGVNAKTDPKKCECLFKSIGVDNTENMILECFRIGRKVDDKVRPMKVKFQSQNIVSSILTNSKKLKDIDFAGNIYIKGDKSKAEMKEFHRLGKRKSELLEQKIYIASSMKTQNSKLEH